MTKRPSTSMAVPGTRRRAAPTPTPTPPPPTPRAPRERDEDEPVDDVPAQKLDCPRCHGVMDLGFLVDRAHGGAIAVASWSRGSPTRSFWTGVKVKGAILLPVGTYRCRTCSYLESYAHPRFAVAKDD